MSGRRHLSDDEQALWSGFARSITPLRPSRQSIKPTAKRASQPAPASSANPQPTPRHARPEIVAPPPTTAPGRSPALAPLGRRFKQRVARGHEAIEARIDLHGLSQSQAHAALLRFLRRAQADGTRTVLVVTGKGSGKNADGGGRQAERGVLRRQVPMWLALPEFRPLIVGFDDAHVGHGGQGALYVRVRRKK